MLVTGGPAQSGRKRGKREARTADWTCDHGHVNPKFATRCLMLGCNVKRGH